MESTIYLSIYYLFFFYFCLIPSINTVSYFEEKSLEKKKEKIVVGKVIVAKAVGIILLYTGRIRFGIIQKGKRITERKAIS